MKNIGSITERLERLKMMLVSEKDFSNTYHYFFDLLGDDDNFMKLEKWEENSDFEGIIQAVGKAFLEEEVIVDGFLLMSLPKQRFAHGLCQVNGNLTTFFFFYEISMGMVAMVNPGGKGDALFARFTAFEAQDKRLLFHGLLAPGSSIH